MRAVLAWVGLALVVLVPLLVAANSPLLAWRSPIYIASGFAGIIALCMLFVQPMLALRALPNLSPMTARRWHGWFGAMLVAAVIVHVLGLWTTSPPDVIDALLLRSPTPFSIWGVLAMWAVFASAVVMATRRRFQLKRTVWKALHLGFAVVIACGTVLHALLIEGTMGWFSKVVVCCLVLIATGYTVWRQVRV